MRENTEVYSSANNLKNCKCVICGASIRHRSPRTKTCSPDCTAKLYGREPRQYRIDTHCKVCGIALLNGKEYCDYCENE